MEVVVLLIALATTGLFMGWRSRRRRRTAPSRTFSDHDRLEARVHERTAALAATLDDAEGVVERLSRLDRERAAFLTGLSHALRSQLNVVHGLTQAIRLHQAAEPLTRRQDQAVEGVASATACLMALTGAVQDLIHVQDVVVARVDPQLAIRDVCLELAEDARSRGVDLRCPAPTAGIGVMADAGRLRRILRCLVSNAIVFNRPGGAVLIEVRQAADGVTLFVHDTGCGIGPDQLATVFQPFARNAGVGAGLGLAGARVLAESMGGRLTAASQQGQGSTFSLHLTAATRAEPRPVHASASPAALPAATVLYVDGATAGAALMRQVLPALGSLTVHVASSGAEGLMLARALRPDVVLMDVDLPDMDGFELKARLDADGLTRDTPVIALSAAALPDDLRRGRAAGFCAWLPKPLEMTALAQALDAALRPPGGRRTAA